ncbi:MAG: hypothetical protein HGA45_11610 [Chloroflexales bacterium]|nr:hypothetical protein [Chloroflexales bacterium]
MQHRLALAQGRGVAVTLEDLVSFGSIGLLQGIDKFDPRKSGRLSTYVTWWIRQAIGRGIAEESRVMTRSVGAKRYRLARTCPRAPRPTAQGPQPAHPAAGPQALL